MLIVVLKRRTGIALRTYCAYHTTADDARVTICADSTGNVEHWQAVACVRVCVCAYLHR